LRARAGLPAFRRSPPVQGRLELHPPGVQRAVSGSFQFSVQNDHLHLLVEASDKRALSAGAQGLAIRTARR
jgi:hypothetical protein